MIGWIGVLVAVEMSGAPMCDGRTGGSAKERRRVDDGPGRRGWGRWWMIGLGPSARAGARLAELASGRLARRAVTLILNVSRSGPGRTGSIYPAANVLSSPSHFTITRPTRPSRGGRPRDVPFSCRRRQSSGRHGVLRHDALGDVAPERDQQFAGHCDELDPSQATSRVADLLVEPAAQIAVRLEL